MKNLTIKNLKVKVESKEILKGVNLFIKKGEIHALMGPNGSGKSTLASAIMGHPKYHITGGQILVDKKNILGLSSEKRAKLGLFLSFQHPEEVAGLSLENFLRTAFNNLHKEKLSVLDFHKKLQKKLALMKMDVGFAARSLNEGFSGGEKKQAEILQMAVLEPQMAILDETDSGLDIDALKAVAKGVNSLAGSNLGILLITHYYRILKYIKPDFVHVMINGRIVKSGRGELATQIEKRGYDWLNKGNK